VPIALTPQTIREAFVAQLIACGVDNVVSTRPRPWNKDDVPGVNVFSPGSNGDSISAHLPRFETTIRIVCSATVALPEGGEFEDKDKALGDAMDAIELQIKTAILGDDVFAASFRRWGGLAVEKGGDTTGERFRGAVRIEFSVIYNEQYTLTKKGGYDDLEQLDIVTDISTPTRLVTHDGDSVVTHDGERVRLIGGSPTFLCRPIYRERIATHNGDSVVTHDGDNLVTDESFGFEAA
jgi:hypothetical protein